MLFTEKEIEKHSGFVVPEIFEFRQALCGFREHLEECFDIPLPSFS